MGTQLQTGRANQKKRTYDAIVDAARDLIGTGGEVTMAAVATSALVSEATAYRYFPDLASLLREALAGVWASPADALEPVARSGDPAERVAYAAEHLLRGVLRYQGAVRAMISATITRPDAAAVRPGIRLGLIEYALTSPDGTPAPISSPALAQLKRDLAVVMSPEALFTLTDLCGLTPDGAIASAVRTARTLTEAATRCNA
jgi:AcrR family transcriptional regulator